MTTNILKRAFISLLLENSFVVIFSYYYYLFFRYFRIRKRHLMLSCVTTDGFWSTGIAPLNTQKICLNIKFYRTYINNLFKFIVLIFLKRNNKKLNTAYEKIKNHRSQSKRQIKLIINLYRAVSYSSSLIYLFDLCLILKVMLQTM
ncbi:hypothetical protein EDEG_03179 [Edhazardia aedis USNM 41457]|uniref:Uncharacterized protein n=1 Tax=Edhazardia aedis (strain USNM 41457) TaxID=1003232 RepID=J8ZRS1_EDHAE|nr:hypothetical protein EDEG_03179 [Edhazardia aedis USNM 41457]|eukprot:EJW02393.1 hypothetical protein EDEG_03179 [Edhazardia aedis USNM 41457]